MARTKKKTADPAPELEIRADPEVIAEELEPVKPERSHTELMMLRGLGLLPPGEDFIPTSLFVSNNVLTSGMGGDLDADIDASGVASFNIPGKAFTTIAELIVDIIPVQEGSGDPAPDNVRPISGWSSAKVTRCGVNQWDEEPLSGYYSSGTGAYVYNARQLCSKNFIPVKPNTQYLYQKSVNLGDILFYNAHMEFISAQINKPANAVFTTPENAYYLQINLGAVYGAAYNNDVGINYPSSDTAYHPYNGQTFTIDLDGMRYGGTLDVRRGKLRVTHRYDLLNDPTKWVASSGPTNVYYTEEFSDRKKYSDSYTGVICSYIKVSSNDMLNTGRWLGATDNRFGIRSEAVTLESVQTDASANKIAILYELATPIEVDLTPTQINALLGVNNIWADCGPVTKLEYSYDLLINQN